MNSFDKAKESCVQVGHKIDDCFPDIRKVIAAALKDEKKSKDDTI